MKREIQHPDKQVNTGAYSAAIEMDGWVWVSGQGPLDLNSGEVLRGSVEHETRVTLDNVRHILQSAACDLQDVVKCTVHLADIGAFDEFNAAYADFFRGCEPLPARTTVQSVLWGGIQVEIDAVARKKDVN